MKNKNSKTRLIKYLIAVFVISIVSVGASLFASAVITNAQADFTPKDKYAVGEMVVIPDGTISGKKADVSVVYPNGTKKATKKVVFDMPGRYEVVYSATVNGKTVEERIPLLAYDKSYASTSTIDTVEYREMDLVCDEQGTTAKKAGIYSDLSEGATFKYNDVVDLSDATKDKAAFACHIVSTKKQYCDFWLLTVRFTDVYDPTNYVDVLLQHNGDNSDHANDVNLDSINYVRAGATGQTPTAFNAKENTLQVGRFGNWAYVSMMSNVKTGTEYIDTFDIYFDYAERKVYGPTKNMAGVNLICDLDDPYYFGENLWQGFTTGECYVSVFAQEYKTAKGGIFVTDIYGKSSEDLAKEYIEDVKTPLITVDFDGYDEDNLPNAVVNRHYPVFSAVASNLYGYCSPASAKVYFNYNTTKPMSVSVKNGKFTPDTQGIYTIEYKSKDGFGNESKKAVNITCNALAEPLKIAIDDDRVISAEMGALVTVAGYSSENASGRLTVDIKAVCGNVSYDIDESMTFRPKEDGEYDVVYTAVDFAGQTATSSYKVNVEAGNQPQFSDDVQLPKYFIAGYKQVLPLLTACDYKDGRKLIEAKVFVKEGSAAEREIDRTEFVPIVPTSGDGYELTIIYRAVGKYGTSERVYKIPCVSVFDQNGDIDKSKLFAVGEGVEREFVSTEYASNAGYLTQTEGGRMTYVNPIPANRFSFVFTMCEGRNNFDKINLYLSDSISDATVKATLERKDNNSIYFSVNDGNRLVVGGISFNNFKKTFNIAFNNLVKQIIVNEVNEFSVKTNVDGSPFNGFESSLVYLTVEFEGVNGQSEIVVSKVGNQLLNDYSNDNTEPLFDINGAYQVDYNINDQLTILDITCVDMIMPYLSKSLTVYTPEGRVVTDINGKRLNNVDVSGNYTIKLTEYGRYKISYKIDGFTNSVSEYIEVVDRTPPEVAVKTAIKDVYKLGDVISLDFSATDNMTEVKGFATVEKPDGTVVTVNDAKFKFTQKGKYRIMICAMDQRGNLTQKLFLVTVE